MISYQNYSEEYLSQIHDLILLSISTINSQDYNPETIEIMMNWQSITKLQSKFDNSYYIIALENNKVVGIGGLVNNEISTMFTHPQYSKQGIGSNILLKLEQFAHTQGIAQLQLSSTITAHNFYTKNGFTEIRRTIHKLDGHDFEVYEMQKNLIIK